jgi:hypothetical protein
MKRFLTCCLFVIVALAACASAESLIFNLNHTVLGGNPVVFTGGLGNTWTITVKVTTVNDGTFASNANCTSCTLTLTTGPLGSFTSGPTGSDVWGAGTYSVSGGGMSGAGPFGAINVGTSGPPNNVGPYATNGTSGSTFSGGAFSGFTSTAFEPGSPGFVTVLTAFHLPTGAQFFPYSGPVNLFFTNFVSTANGGFTAKFQGGTLELDSAPETSSIILIGAGLSFVGLLWRRRQRSA